MWLCLKTCYWKLATCIYKAPSLIHWVGVGQHATLPRYVLRLNFAYYRTSLCSPLDVAMCCVRDLNYIAFHGDSGSFRRNLPLCFLYRVSSKSSASRKGRGHLPYIKSNQIKSNQIEFVLLLRQYPQQRPGSVTHQTNQCPKAKSQDSVQKHQQTIGCAGIYGGKAKSKRCVFRRLLKDAVEGADRTKKGGLFHRVGPQERKALAPVLVLTLGTEKLIPFFDLSERGGTDRVNIAFK